MGNAFFHARQYVVSIIQLNSVQGCVYGPFDNWQEAEDVLIAHLEQGDEHHEPVVFSKQDEEKVREQGEYAYEDGSEVNIALCEQFDWTAPVKPCPKCYEPMKNFMKDMDGTNLEQVFGCPNCDS